MRKFLVGFLMFFVFAVTVPIAVEAQTCRTRKYRKSNASRSYARNYNRRYSTRGYRSTRRPSVYRRHRNLINIGIGTGAGAIIGGLLGGKRGALIGAGVGAGSGAAYTYGIRPKRKRYYRRY